MYFITYSKHSSFQFMFYNKHSKYDPSFDESDIVKNDNCDLIKRFCPYSLVDENFEETNNPK